MYIRCAAYVFVMGDDHVGMCVIHDRFSCSNFAIDPNDSKMRGSAFKNKLFPLSELFSIFRENPVVPLFADMPLQLQLVLEAAPSYTHELGSKR